MSIADYLHYWLLSDAPYNALSFMKSFASFMIKERLLFDNSSKKIRAFRNIHSGKRCFILATGPSINAQDLSVLAREYCFGVGQFYLHPHIRHIQPQYHVHPPMHPPFESETAITLLKGHKRCYADETIVFLGDSGYKHSFRNVITRYPENKRLNYFFINYRNPIFLSEHNYKKKSMWDISGWPFPIYTVVFGALQIALYMGFKEIYLLGCDHDYLKDVTRVTNHHFFKEEEGISDVEHLTSRYNTEKWFLEYYNRWKTYRLVKEHAANIGCTIYNATPESMLDVFAFKSLEDVFGK